jgi:hypothetical protein
VGRQVKAVVVGAAAAARSEGVDRSVQCVCAWVCGCVGGCGCACDVEEVWLVVVVVRFCSGYNKALERLVSNVEENR